MLAATLLLFACSSGDAADRATASRPPSPPAPSFTPEGPPRTLPGSRRVVVGTVAIAVPRGWSACRMEIIVPTGLEGPIVSFVPPGGTAGYFSPLRFQVDPPPGEKLFDARNARSWLRDELWPGNDGRIGEIDVPNAIQTAATEYTTRDDGRRLAGFDAWAMGQDETRTGLFWFSARSWWKDIEPVYRDIAASIEFGVDEAPTPLPACPRP
jgi:hypothetical protein